MAENQEFTMEKVYNPQQIEDKLSEQMLEGKVTTGKKYICKAENGEFVFAEQTEPESAENE